MHFVYLLASRKNGTLYLGVTNDLARRVHQHKTKALPGFSSRYGVSRLVWFEAHDDPTSAIAREKDIKKWRREWRVRLINRRNPNWNDLYDSITEPGIQTAFRQRTERVAAPLGFRVRRFAASRNDGVGCRRPGMKIRQTRP